MDQYAFRAPGQLTASSPEYIPQSYVNNTSTQYRGMTAAPDRTGTYGSTQPSAYYSRSSSVYSNTDSEASMSYSHYSGNSSPHSSPPHSPRNGSYIGSNPYATTGQVEQHMPTSSASFRSSTAPFRFPTGGDSYGSSLPKAFETPATQRNITSQRSFNARQSRPPPASLFHFGNIFLDWKL